MSDHYMTDVVVGGECAFCDNPCDGVIEDDEFLPLVHVEDKSGARFPVCDDHWAEILSRADLSKIKFDHGFVLFHS